MHIHIIIHEAFEGPAAIESWIEKNNHQSNYTRLYNGEELPLSSHDIDFLIIMGGPQSPYTTTEECSYFNSEAEQAIIKNAVEANKMVLGICLGAQMISNALGGQTVASPHKEIGLFPVSITDEGRKDSLFVNFPEHFLCGHWHGDMPGLTNDAVILAESEGCARQVVRFAPKVYGFQCHFEFTPSAIDAMILNNSDELVFEKDKPFVQGAELLRANDYSNANQLLFIFLDGLAAIS